MKVLKIIMPNFFIMYIVKKLSQKHQYIIFLKKLKQYAIEMKNDFEISVIDSYFPKQLSTEELTTIINVFIKQENITNASGMGKVMAHLKDKYANLYNGKEASDLIKTILNGNN